MPSSPLLLSWDNERIRDGHEGPPGPCSKTRGWYRGACTIQVVRELHCAWHRQRFSDTRDGAGQIWPQLGPIPFLPRNPGYVDCRWSEKAKGEGSKPLHCSPPCTGYCFEFHLNQRPQLPAGSSQSLAGCVMWGKLPSLLVPGHLHCLPRKLFLMRGQTPQPQRELNTWGNGPL